MSSESDRVAFDHSVEPYDETVLFQDKKWTFITDSSSNGGVFNSQIQWDLNTLSSQSQWVDLSQAYVQFPIRVKIRNAGTLSLASVTTTNALTCLKNNFANMIDSVQLVVDGATLQTSQIFENIAANFRVLSEWSQDTLNKYGDSVGIVFDNYNDIENVATSTLIPAIYGINTTAANTAINARQQLQNNLAAGAGASANILASQARNLGKSQVAVVTNTTVAANSHCYTQFVLATIRLCDICPAVKDMPMTRNLKGFLYLNFNSSLTTITTTAGAALSTISTVASSGRTCPVLINQPAVDLSNLLKASATWELECTISGVATDLSAAQPQQQNATLWCPYYVANPTVDSALSMKKTYRYLERNVSTFDIGAGANQTITLTPGISNADGVLLFPYYTGSSTISNLLSNPLLSITDTCPSTSSPFATLKDLQILVGNKPIFNNPVNYTSSLFLQEIAQLGAEGGLDNQLASGLLTQQDFERLYNYHYINVGRRLESEDGSSKSIIVQATNPTTCNMRVIAMVFYQKEITIDTSNGRIFQGRQ